LINLFGQGLTQIFYDFFGALGLSVPVGCKAFLHCDFKKKLRKNTVNLIK